MRPPARPDRVVRAAARLLLAGGVLVSGCTSGEPTRPQPRLSPVAARLFPDEARLAAASPELRRRLASSPIALFRFVNQAWTREVCTAFAGDLTAMPTARLHGDAHVEQYAVSATSRGIDDFDDSSTGPAVVDMVRFLGSLELTARARGWDASLPAIGDAFFDGDRRALKEPPYLPPDPAVARRLRALPVLSQQDVLAWADSLGKPLEPEDRARVDAVWARVEAYAATLGPEFTPAFLRLKRVGWARLGIGSALRRKIVLHIEGPSPARDDDVVLEGKEVAALRDLPCLSVPASGEAFRVIEGLGEIGRLTHRLTLALPMLAVGRPEVRGWWLRTWDRSYRELEIGEIVSAEELREVAHDVGAQLGSTNLVEGPAAVNRQKRMVEIEGLARLVPRIRQVAHDLTAALLEAWQQFRKG